ncbi:hypothetical protein [Bordetella sp. 15P40C-2]|uniref:hypothetical protein n=1 Tax=Bordetella sp. 15P40C-2 TaxID=2572246 RepID=UPI00132C12DF|nr:hypothetical protein [Bordetella sp. 15P40C-2]MVW72119.1 hypothetical protein [Bordetella sp. 15P40C-2]
MANDRIIRGLESWDNEGGAQIATLAAAFEIEDFEASEQRILAFLGASLLCLWDELPTDARQAILNQKAVQKAYDESLVKTRIQSLQK